MKLLRNYSRVNLRFCTSGIFYTSVHLHPATSSTLYDHLELVSTRDTTSVKIKDWV